MQGALLAHVAASQLVIGVAAISMTALVATTRWLPPSGDALSLVALDIAAVVLLETMS